MRRAPRCGAGDLRAAWLARALLLAGICASGSVAGAQPTPDPPVPRVSGAVPAARPTPRLDVTILGGLLGGADLGGARATVVANQVPTGGTTALFTTDTTIAAAPTVEARLGVRLSRAWGIEVGAAYARPEFRVRISGDVEGVPDVTATSRLTQFIVDTSLQYRWAGRRVTPFVMAGAGYVRQLDEPRTTGETGTAVHGGGGVRVAIAPGSRGVAGRLALRADARVVWLRDGIRLEEQRRPTFTISGGMTIGLW